ncbi:DUF6498-containing protein [Halobaculum lipolyticum]|uniref:DUF6498-containing protein n=1 Tax=Halobaculum lipolyticum TaxID=3032001 RepID=A0ABD5W825_9EURY|nr:DUF6498-containing protein [Halobaculum sp. DT31]
MVPGSVAGGDLRAFVPTLLATLLPLAGVGLLGWRVAELLVVYWIELWALLVVYAGAALFARRAVVVEGRNLTLPGVSSETGRDEQRWSGEPRALRLPGPLPPIYPRNARLVAHSLVWGVGLLTVPVWAVDLGDAALATLSPPLAAVALATVGSHALTVRRDYLATGRIETVSAHMVLEIPVRVVAFAFTYVSVALVVGGFCLLVVWEVLGAVGVTVGDDAVVLALVAVVVLGKLAIEWSRHAAAAADDPTGFATWFRPEDPRE